MDQHKDNLRFKRENMSGHLMRIMIDRLMRRVYEATRRTERDRNHVGCRTQEGLDRDGDQGGSKVWSTGVANNMHKIGTG